MRKEIKYYPIVLLLLLTSCASIDTDPLAYVQDEANGLRKTISNGGITYKVQYRPPASILHTEQPDSNLWEERGRQLEGMAWFNITFSVDGFGQSPLRYQLSSLEDYTARQDYYLNHAMQDMYLLYGRDTLYPRSYWFENNQNLAAHETIIVGFKLPGNETTPERDMQFSFYDQAFKNGIIKATIYKKDLNRALNVQLSIVHYPLSINH